MTSSDRAASEPQDRIPSGAAATQGPATPSESAQPQDRTPGPAFSVAVVGTGTMGQGIAQVALLAGHHVYLHDVAEGRAKAAVGEITARLDRLVEKGRITSGARHQARARLVPVTTPGALFGCGLVIEAVTEQLAVKQELFKELEKIVEDDCILATNTSSLSVTAIAGALRVPGRFVGLHFFNPAPLLPLVEVVSGSATDEAVTTRAYELMKSWGKTPVRSADTPGFIVNRIARPFYAEAFRLYEERAADPATIDAVLRECGGFKMGPFELTDLIGQDVNEAVTRSVWESFFQDPKFTPSLAQQRLVQSGRLGRKSGQGWFSYEEGASKPEPPAEPPADAPRTVTVHGDLGQAKTLVRLAQEAGLQVEFEDDPEPYIELPGGGLLFATDGLPAGAYPGEDVVVFDWSFDYAKATRIALAAGPRTGERARSEAAGFFQALGKKVTHIRDVPGMIVARTVAMLVDLAADAVAREVTSEQDADTAMRLGVNYPVGLLEWAAGTGELAVALVLRNLHEYHPTGRYGPTPGLLGRIDPLEYGDLR
ncbi:3-hydroxyacyl-CoA dehydrogenase [Streptomyces indicus]|uniref:3-hydroxybutyryl-CoA dehydrogenase n=1 Tax=Streptomyces indicus TaxID=417292 RepID=A0A1G9CQG1_9ACTN|nr:3-hydroxyacyl-CoA dehydrogenase [Streptomyces indicus]SDK53836.1 3-hydroxybutyryl-CoA dehydrogenase [Streptomyces indicus]